MNEPDRPDCPRCDSILDDEENNDAVADDPDHEYFCPTCGALFVEGEVTP